MGQSIANKPGNYRLNFNNCADVAIRIAAAAEVYFNKSRISEVKGYTLPNKTFEDNQSKGKVINKSWQRKQQALKKRQDEYRKEIMRRRYHEETEEAE